MPSREQIAAALKYVGDKANLRQRFERATSLDPQEQDMADIAVETGASFIPGVGQALAARDVERARRANDPAGMAMASMGVIPGGKLVRMVEMVGDVKPQKIAEALEKTGKGVEQPFGVMGYDTNTLRRAKQNFSSQYGLEEGKQFTKDYEVVPMGKLRPTEKIEENKVQSLMETMRAEGNALDTPIPPIIVDSNGNILDGHNRYEAAKRLKAKYIPVIELYDKNVGSIFSE